MRPAREFVASVHGLPFPNAFAHGTPVVSIRTPFGVIAIGDASGGVCGGMVFAAADYFLAGQAVPAHPTPPVFEYLCKRLLDSWALPFGALKYFDWQRRPTVSTTWAGVPLIDGTRRLTLTSELPRLEARLHAGLLAPLGLVQASGLSPRNMGCHHQVLAYACETHGEDVIIRIYDPNHPHNDSCTITGHRRDAEGADLWSHSVDGPRIRGFFNVDYEPRPDPATATRML